MRAALAGTPFADIANANIATKDYDDPDGMSPDLMLKLVQKAFAATPSRFTPFEKNWLTTQAKRRKPSSLWTPEKPWTDDEATTLINIYVQRVYAPLVKARTEAQ
jgi:hypothetical protein